LFAVALATTAALAMAPTAHADEKDEKENETPVTMDTVPAPARATLQREAAGGQIVNVVKETDNGQTVYEAHVRQGSEVVGIEVDPNGKLLKKESETNEGH
jgi:uncharacterized membrane protein YkoI